MSSFFHNLFHSFSPSSNSYQDYQPHHENLLGSGPKDWLSNAAVFAGTDYLLNRYDENHNDQIHHWRNAGLAGAAALGFQHFKNNHYYQPSSQYYYSNNNNYGYTDPSTLYPYGSSYYGSYNTNNNNMMYYPYAQPMGPQPMMPSPFMQQTQTVPYYYYSSYM